jgi:DNA mismatch repair protein MutS
VGCWCGAAVGLPARDPSIMRIRPGISMPDEIGPTRQVATVPGPSILFGNAADRPLGSRPGRPGYFTDLNLDQIVAAIIEGAPEYDLEPFFFAPLHSIDTILFRHEVMRDLEAPSLLHGIKRFALGMRKVRERLAHSRKVHHRLQQQRWFHQAVCGYIEAVTRLADDLAAAQLCSHGFLRFKDYLDGYRCSAEFVELQRQTEELDHDIAAILYTILIQGSRVDIRVHDGEGDYSTEVLATFERFRQGTAQSFRFDFAEPIEINHIEAQVLDRVALLYSDTFATLASYCDRNIEFLNEVITTFDREIQFYVAYIEYMARFKALGLNFCYPRLTETRGEIFDYQGYDLALAGNLSSQRAVPVCNDFHLRGPERIIVVSGPNQGGKTTFARTFGQLHHLGALGCSVPGVRAQLYLFDQLFTHFERAENIGNLRGKLQDDLVRVHHILKQATPSSIVVMNEIFASTTLHDAKTLSRRVAATLIDLDLYCVWVTFIDELASLGAQTVSMASSVVPGNPAERTFKILRRPADGLAYALSIAERHRLTYEMVKDRIGR